MEQANFFLFEKIRKDFPNISNNTSYLDSAATTQKPRYVIEKLSQFYETSYATVHRAIYTPAQEATCMYQEAREKVAKFLHASSREIIFTRGTTDSLNILADSLSVLLKPGESIVVSALEHHSNLVPWQIAAKRSGASLVVLPITDSGQLCLDALESLLSRGNVKIVAITHCSNVIGTINPIQAIAQKVHKAEAYLVVDGAQSLPHMRIDVAKLDCDAFAFSGHKVYGPSGIGILYVRESLLEKLPPTRGGGDMVDVVTMEESTYAPIPVRFEPGTPPITQAIGLGHTLDYIQSLDLDTVYAYEMCLYATLREKLEAIDEITLLGPTENKIPLLSFVIKNCHPLDVATLMNVKGVYIRSGNLCCQPLLQRLGYTAVNRISLALYNSVEDVERAVQALKESMSTLSPTVFFASE
jgi:cysteine desulfurase / selenocysteine lyase